MKHVKRIIIILLILFISFMGLYKIYVSKYYRSNYSSDQCMEKENLHIFNPDTETNTALIFYPGAKVEAESYAPLFEALSNKGILCICIEMPDNLAILDVDAANEVIEKYPQIQHWYLGGHSLGGAMASTFISDNTDIFDGLILLASYSTKDLSNTDLKVLSIYGSNDEVLNLKSYEEYKNNYPDTFEEYIIQGGCHAFFGNYGKQKGDGIPTISYEEQLQQTVEIIYSFINK